MQNYKQEFLDMYFKANNTSQKMQEFYKKDLEFAVKLGNNYLTIDKPRIKKDFCFGYGQNGISTKEDIKDACNMARHTRESQEFFINENLEVFYHLTYAIQYHIIKLKEGWDKAQEFYQKNEKLIPYTFTIDTPYLVSYYNYPRVVLEFVNWDREQDNRIPKVKATAEDLETILSAYNEVIANFKKRLNTYLKKYGLSKVKSWTYLVD